jgi:hypothetical protein
VTVRAPGGASEESLVGQTAEGAEFACNNESTDVGYATVLVPVAPPLGE